MGHSSLKAEHQGSFCLSGITRHIEHLLSSYYHFSCQAEFHQHIMTPQHLNALLSESTQDLLDSPAAVLIQEGDGKQEIFLGVHIREDLRDKLLQQNPIELLNKDNLNAFCTLVEEVSHFHFIVNRAVRDHSFRKIETEWQGEIDKLLIVSQVLKSQIGGTHHRFLAHMLYDSAVITSKDVDLYQDATRYAALFWYELFQQKNFSMESRHLQQTLQELYKLTWNEKASLIEQRSFNFAS